MIFVIGGFRYRANSLEEAEGMSRILNPKRLGNGIDETHEVIRCWKTRNGRASIERSHDTYFLCVSDYINHPEHHFDGFATIVFKKEEYLSEITDLIHATFETPYRVRMGNQKTERLVSFSNVRGPWSIVESSLDSYTLGFSSERDEMAFRLAI